MNAPREFLVTGASGFVGRELCRQLAASGRIRALSRRDADGPWAETFTADKFSPQVTLRYRPNENMSVYARYAEAFKIGGFDTGQTSCISLLL